MSERRIVSLDRILEDFGVLDDWDERYRYIIDLGRKMAPFPDAARNDAAKVRGCASKVWLVSSLQKNAAGKEIVALQGDSDALIVKGLIAILFELYADLSPQEILNIDARKSLGQLGLDTHLSQQRSNGLYAMVERIRADATAALKKN